MIELDSRGQWFYPADELVSVEYQDDHISPWCVFVAGKIVARLRVKGDALDTAREILRALYASRA